MDLLTKSREFAISEIKRYGLPNIIHFELSENKAIELAEKLGADKTIVQVGVFLMDVKLGQAFNENRVPQHISMSLDATKELIEPYSLPNDMKQKIYNCVEAHHGSVPYMCLEAEICANADCYRFIHPKGFFLFLTILGRRGTNFLECLSEAERKMDEKYAILSLDMCKEELTKYYNTLKKFIHDAKH